jgi:hypothetical protein
MAWRSAASTLRPNSLPFINAQPDSERPIPAGATRTAPAPLIYWPAVSTGPGRRSLRPAGCPARRAFVSRFSLDANSRLPKTALSTNGAYLGQRNQQPFSHFPRSEWQKQAGPANPNLVLMRPSATGPVGHSSRLCVFASLREKSNQGIHDVASRQDAKNAKEHPHSRRGKVLASPPSFTMSFSSTCSVGKPFLTAHPLGLTLGRRWTSVMPPTGLHP